MAVVERIVLALQQWRDFIPGLKRCLQSGRYGGCRNRARQIPRNDMQRAIGRAIFECRKFHEALLSFIVRFMAARIKWDNDRAAFPR